MSGFKPDAQYQPGALRRSDVLRPELKLVCACCSVTAGREARIAAALERISSQNSWTLALKITRQHHVAGLVFRALQPFEIPQDVQTSLSHAALQQTILSTRLTLENVLVQRILRRAGLPVVFAGGTALARRLYGDVAPRHARDVDAFTTAMDLAAAHSALLAAGYQQIAPARPFRGSRHFTGGSITYADPARGLPVRLHGQFGADPACDPCPGQPAPPVAMIDAGEQIATLPDTDLFCYLCLRGEQPRRIRVKWLADMAAFVPQLPDLPGVITAAYERGLIGPATVALILTRDLMGWNMPAGLAAALPDSRNIRTRIAAAKRTLIADGVRPRSNLHRLWLSLSPRTKHARPHG